MKDAETYQTNKETISNQPPSDFKIATPNTELSATSGLDIVCKLLNTTPENMCEIYGS
ncbi:MAG: hypothetical protein ACOCXQ_04415 [Patescibacteria group bacterium]